MTPSESSPDEPPRDPRAPAVFGQEPTTTFTHTRPAGHGGQAFALFDEGRSYRVVRGRSWYIYNDTLSQEAHVDFSFPPQASVERAAGSRATLAAPDARGWTRCTVTVYPLETVPFVHFRQPFAGRFEFNNHTVPLAAAYVEKTNAKATHNCEAEIRRVAALAAEGMSNEDLLYQCRKSNVMFVDLYFKPTQSSLRRPSDLKDVSNIEQITWMRPSSMIPKEAQVSRKLKLYRANLEPERIVQGELGDCWLISAMAAAATMDAAMIKDMFRHPVSKSKQRKEQKVGAYRVYLNKCGWWQNVIVDSYLPTYNCALRFARSAEDPYELWVSMLEKAYAKVHGSYASIIGGDAFNALQDLTGFPVRSFNDCWKEIAGDDAKAEQLFQDLLRYHKKEFIVSIKTPEDTGRPSVERHDLATDRTTGSCTPTYNRMGLVTDHAYSLLQVVEVGASRTRLLKLRNPSESRVSWTGAWSAGSDKWTEQPEAQVVCKPSAISDGTFWMEWRDVVQYFDGGGVCMVKKHWYDYRFQGKFVGIHPSFSLKLEVTKPQKIFFTLSQRDRRLLDPSDPEKLYKDLLIAVSCRCLERGEAQEVTAISTSNPEVHPAETFTFNVKRDVSVDLVLDPARSPYYITPRIMVANKGGPKDYTLGVLTPVKSTEKGMRISFVRLSEGCPLFRNITVFDPHPEKMVNMQFQYKKRGGVPRLKEGTDVCRASAVREDFPFPY